MWHMIVYGNSDKTRLAVKNTTISLHVTHDSIDFTGLIAVLDHYPRLAQITSFDRIFYMHDTMVVYNSTRFSEALQRYSQSRTCSLQMGQSMNIGIYTIRDLVRSNETLNMLRGKDHPNYGQRLALKNKGKHGWEGVIFDQAKAWASYENCGCELSKGPDSQRNSSDDLFKGRRKLEYREWGFFKFQTRGESRIFSRQLRWQSRG
jgi:hypothetical protein